ncbi:PDZ domain-containing protein [Streptomyces avermitilis]|uniref:PDZ domain-containing protein n=1 Tax=Streptomyces avermitilis TaxID=33903 RepID=UPI0033A480B4
MEQTALRPKPMPGQEPGGDRASGTPRRPHAAPPRRGKRLTTLLFALLIGTVLVLSGIGLGTVGATVIGMSKLAELQRQMGGGAGAAGPSGPLGPPASGRPGAPVSGGPQSMGSKAAQGDSGATAVLAPGKATLGVEAVDATSKGALVVGVHAPGPGYTAGLVRGDILLAFGRTRLDSAADLARAVAGAHPGTAVALTVRHMNGSQEQLTATPGIVT